MKMINYFNSKSLLYLTLHLYIYMKVRHVDVPHMLVSAFVHCNPNVIQNID
jgi:hypothetical protein